MSAASYANPDSKVHEANMGPIWGRQDPGGPHVGPMNLAIWEHHLSEAGAWVVSCATHSLIHVITTPIWIFVIVWRVIWFNLIGWGFEIHWYQLPLKILESQVCLRQHWDGIRTSMSYISWSPVGWCQKLIMLTSFIGGWGMGSFLWHQSLIYIITSLMVPLNSLKRHRMSMWLHPIVSWRHFTHLYPNIMHVMGQKQASCSGKRNYNPQCLWDVITCPCPFPCVWYNTAHIIDGWFSQSLLAN